MNCSQCGAPISGDAKFCTACGTPVAQPAVSQDQPAEQAPAAQQPQAEPQAQQPTAQQPQAEPQPQASAAQQSQQPTAQQPQGQYQQPGYQQPGYQQPGYQQQGYQQQPQEVVYTTDGNLRAFTMTMYWAGLIGIIMCLSVCDRRDEFVRFHLNQAFVLFIFSIICFVFSFLIIPGLFAIFVLVCVILGTISAHKGTCKEVPLLGKIHWIK